MKYLAEMDGLRVLAVVLVILFHAGFELFSGGFVGVDAFFVISGYLITFFSIVRKRDDKAVGLASFLRINQTDGSIEVGHINYSPLLQRTREGTEAMFLMMEWAIENGYRRYEWKCNALNKKSRYAAQIHLRGC